MIASPRPVATRASKWPLLRLTATLALLTLASVARSAGPEWAPNVTFAATWHDNANNAVDSDDQLDSLQLGADLLSSNDYAFGRDDTLRLTAHLAGDFWPRYRKLLGGAGGGRAEWRHTFGAGPLAPALSLEGGADALYTGERARNGTTSFALLALRKRLNDRWRALVQHEFSRHDARHTVYDRTSSETTLELGFDATKLSRFTLAARYRNGDVVSYATTPSADVAALARVSELTDTFDRPLVASSFDARTWSARAAYFRALDDSSAIVLAYELRNSRAQPVRFTNNILSVSLVHQF